jgi:hypothetical protein
MRTSLHATSHVTLALLVSLAFVLVLATLLNYSKFLTTYTELSDRRIALVSQWARDSVEVLLNLGLELKGLQAAPEILAQAKSRYPYVENISLFDGGSGRILYSTSPDLVGKQAPAEWLARQAASREATWHIDGADPAIAGIRLDSSFLKGVGGIAIVYSTGEAHRKIAMMRERLVVTALAVFAAFALIAVIFALLATRGMRRTLTSLTDALDPDRDEQADGRGLALPDPMRGPTDAFRHNAATANRELAQAERELADAASSNVPEDVPAIGEDR